MNNTLALLNWYRPKGVMAVKTPSGIRLMGLANISKLEQQTLLKLTQQELEAALKWQN